MLPIQSKSSAAPTALIYITIGALLSVWSGVWFLYENSHENPSRGVHFVCAGLLLTGIALLAIGFGIGAISRKAQTGELIAQANAAQAVAVAKDPSLAQKV